MSQFRVGDRVRVTDTSSQWYGQEGVVVEVTNTSAPDLDPWQVKVRFDDGVEQVFGGGQLLNLTPAPPPPPPPPKK